jgi:hypothetical protein
MDPGEGLSVQMDKDEVVELLRSRGEHDKAASVDCALPKRVDTEADAGVLHQFGVKVSDLAEAVDTSTGNPVAGAGSA